MIKDELDRRKKTIQEFDQQRKKNIPLDDIEQEAKDEAQYMLKRANELRQEQEDEVKYLNEVCLKHFVFFVEIKNKIFSS